ncbi:DoxX family protein [Paenibacillus allorhizosphaerae]|uniref:Oxidoreductase CatD n=1 Tax=Paenibacillus allorhizosphaerae TaxID=2849866 RepID=A0ABM8VCN5_9BACL|nr:DoxX family protein [Paenibacillus allorhizosphaerae]CAG7624627.1 Putative oxidoreductase CatD [Paenibacillus allorhizosphaerae]
MLSNVKLWSYTVVRVLLGIIFLVHGTAKFQMGLGNVSNFFQSLGLPGALGYLVAIIELVGGIALIVGLGSRYIAALLFLVMIGAIVKVKLGLGLMGDGKSPGYELELALALASLYIAAENYKQFGLDRFLMKHNPSA